MDDRTQNSFDPGSFFTAWVKSAADFWQPFFKPAPAASPAETGRERPLERATALWQAAMKAMGAMSSAMGKPGNADALFNTADSLPQLAQSMCLSAMRTAFVMQRQYMEKAGRMEVPAETRFFEFLDQESLKAWAEIYEKEIRPFLNAPPLGLTRIYQEKFQQTADRFNQFQARLMEFVNILSLPMEKSFQTMQERIAQLAETGSLPEDPKDYYNLWIKVLEGHYMVLFKTSDYTESLSGALNAFEDYLVSREGLLEDFLKIFPVATNKDMDALSEEIYRLKKRVRMLEKRMAV